MENVKKFPPPANFIAQAHIKSAASLQAFRETAAAQPEAFWKELANALLWDKPYDRLLDWKMPVARWFDGGKLNVSKNCLDKHLKNSGSKTAIVWEGEPSDGTREQRRLNYRDLHALTCQIANTLKARGVGKGDRVAIYMPMTPEIVAAMLACARIGAVHTVVFGGFSATSLYDRILDCQAKCVITSDGTWRKGKWLSLKSVVDEALARPGHGIGSVLVFRRDASQPCPLQKGRDFAWDEHVLKASPVCEATPLESEDPLFILYTSGTTGKPKGLFHTQAGYLLWAHWSTRWLFDIKPDDVYWCTADCGWITGHTYVTYGPLSNGATLFMYEGAPTTPAPDRYWEMIDRHKVTILYTAPTAIRMFMRFGETPLLKHNLSSLRLLGTVGEPINPEAWLWYHKNVGLGRCPIVDTYWQTETGGAVIAPLPGATTLKPGSATQPLPGFDAAVVNLETGTELKAGERGALVLRRPWPSMARGIWGDMARFEKTYWNTSPALKGFYLTSDFAVKDTDGDFWVEGRLDDVIKVSGHRLGSAEIESALVGHQFINEAAVVSKADSLKGEAIVAFVTLADAAYTQVKDGKLSLEQIKAGASEHVVKEIGALARPEQIRIAKALPKTRSGKIMRRLLREVANTGKISGDTTTLEDFSAEAALSEDA